MNQKIILAIACAVSIACAHTSQTAMPAPAPAMHYGEEDLQAVLWMQTAVEYRAVARETYSAARRSLDAALADPAWSALETSSAAGLPPAIILDIDETCVDNSAYQAELIRTKQLHTDQQFADFVRSGRVSAVPGAAGFLNYAQSRGVTIFYVTNQDQTLETATRENLRRLNLPVGTAEDTVLTLDERPDWTWDKSSRRAFVAQRYRVLILLGDDFNDFVAASGKTHAELRSLYDRYIDYFGTKWFVLPNPAYGSWEHGAIGKEPKSPDQIFDAKIQALRTTAGSN